MARSDSLPVRAAATASRDDAEASWNEMAGALGALSEPTGNVASPEPGGFEVGWLESRLGFGGGASLRDMGATES
jgi:hypothetical protein